MASQARAAVETGRARAAGLWRLGLQLFARVVHIGLGQSLHGGDDARIFGAEVCLVCIVLCRLYGFVPILAFRNYFCFKNALIEFVVLLLLQPHEVVWYIRAGRALAEGRWCQ